MGIYYDTNNKRGYKDGVPEVVESNIGTNYIDYKEGKGFGKSLVWNKELSPASLHGGSRIGVDNKGSRNDVILNNMIEMFHSFSKNFYHETLYMQLETFVKKETKSHKTTFEPVNKFMYKDDTLFSATYSYICRNSFLHKEPMKLKSTEDNYRLRFKRYRDSEGYLSRRLEKMPLVY
jgi:hypothetical protein